MKRSLYLYLSIILAVVVISATTLFVGSASHVNAAGNTYDLSGSAWSDNGGWINFNCANDSVNGCSQSNYKVNADSTGRLRGYAWSYNFGWLSFEDADVAGCPSSPCTPTIDLTNTGSNVKRMSGYGRFLTGIGRTDGWDGWLELSGTNHTSPLGSGVKLTQAAGVPFNSTQGIANGWAFGAIVAWMSFNTQIAGVQCPPGKSFDFTQGICVSDAVSCTGSVPANAIPSTATQNGGTWSYVSTNPAGTPPAAACRFTCPTTAPWDAALKTCKPTGTPPPTLCEPVPANSLACRNNTGGAPVVLLIGDQEDSECQPGITRGGPKCEFYCPNPFMAHSGRCVFPGQIQEN